MIRVPAVAVISINAVADVQFDQAARTGELSISKSIVDLRTDEGATELSPGLPHKR